MSIELWEVPNQPRGIGYELRRNSVRLGLVDDAAARGASAVTCIKMQTNLIRYLSSIALDRLNKYVPWISDNRLQKESAIYSLKWITFLLLFFGSATAQALTPTLIYAEGTVEELRPATKADFTFTFQEKSWIKEQIAVGKTLNPENVLKTGDRSFAILAFDNGDHILLGQNSILKMAWPQAENESYNFKLYSGSGDFFVPAAHSSSKFFVSTASLAATIESPHFSVHMNEPLKEERLINFLGNIRYGSLLDSILKQKLEPLQTLLTTREKNIQTYEVSLGKNTRAGLILPKEASRGESVPRQMSIRPILKSDISLILRSIETALQSVKAEKLSNTKTKRAETSSKPSADIQKEESAQQQASLPYLNTAKEKLISFIEKSDHLLAESLKAQDLTLLEIWKKYLLHIASQLPKAANSPKPTTTDLLNLRKPIYRKGN